MAAATIDVTYEEVYLRFSLATIAKYLSSTWVVTLGRPATRLRSTVWLIWNCFHAHEMMDDEHRRNEQSALLFQVFNGFEAKNRELPFYDRRLHICPITESSNFYTVCLSHPVKRSAGIISQEKGGRKEKQKKIKKRRKDN
ncbi:hypothetical protein TNCV_3251661 [Trichonephila clavipes]|nr:hypothetical protein TNCV_3251661 [Trichonephila clavipes]